MLLLTGGKIHRYTNFQKRKFYFLRNFGLTLKNTLHWIPFLEIRVTSRDHPNQVM